MKDKTLSFIQKYHMVSPGDHVIVALSGGKDSMTLLHLILELKEALGITVSAAHMNHQLRGAEAQRDEDFVTSHCAKLHIPLQVEHKDVSGYAAAQGIGLEEAARTLRYEFLLSLSPDALIATAHTAQDNLETFLMHLVRGCSLQGLTGIPPVRGRIIRPLLLWEPGDIEEYLEARGIPHVEDSTNDTDFCLRNRLRHHILPALTQENPSVCAAVSRLCLQLSQEEAVLGQLARQYYQDAALPHGLSASALQAMPENMAFRVLSLYLKDIPELSRTHLDDALALCRNPSPSARLSLPGKHTLRRSYDLLTLLPEQSAPTPPCVTLTPGDTCFFGPYQISSRMGPCPEALSGNEIALIPPKEGVIRLRTRQQGDRISLPGGTKKLSRYLVDQKIPVSMRDTLPVVLYGDTLAAILPLQADHNFRQKCGKDSLILTVQRLEEVK